MGGSCHQQFRGVKMVRIRFVFLGLRLVTQNFRQQARAFRGERFYFLSKQKHFSASHSSCFKPAVVNSLFLV